MTSFWPNGSIVSRIGWGGRFRVVSRVEEMQVAVLSEEFLQRDPRGEGVGDPVLLRSSFVNGFPELSVRVHVL